ncbi:MAG: Alkyldihydroxyacetonephosphate synthase, partial [uncultured Acidimicrobiales bacterium]
DRPPPLPRHRHPAHRARGGRFAKWPPAGRAGPGRRCLPRPADRGVRHRRDVRPGGPRRGRSRLVAPRHDLGARGGRARPAVGGRPPGRRLRGRRRGGAVQRGAGAAHRSRRAQRRERGERAGARRRRARHDRHVGHHRRRSRLRDRGRAARDLRRHVGGGAASRPRAHPRALAAVDRPLHRRGVARLPLRRPALHPVREDRGHGGGARRGAGRRHHGADGGRPPGRRRARPQPGVRRLRGDARRHHLGPAPLPPSPGHHPQGGLRVPLLRRRDRGPPHDPASRRHPGGGPNVRPDRGGPQLVDGGPGRAPRARRGRPGAGRRHDDGGGRGLRGRSTHGRRARRPVARAPQRRVRPRGAHPEGLRGRHHGDRRTVVEAAPAVRGGAGGPAGHRRDEGGLCPPVPQLHRRRLPVLLLRRPSTVGRAGVVLRAGVGRGHRRRPRRGRRPQPPPRCRPQPQPVHGRGPRRRHAGPAVAEDGARPERDPQPGQARAGLAVRRPCLAEHL